MSDLSSYDRGEGAAAAAGPSAFSPAPSGSSLASPALAGLPAPGADSDGLAEAAATLLSTPEPAPDRAAQPPRVPDATCSSASASSAVGCPKHPAALREESVHTVTVAGSLRSFIYYAPETLDPELPAPLLILAHARSVGASELLAITQLETLADREGFLLLAPDGQRPNPWNIGRDNCPATSGPIANAAGDDQAFLDAMLAFVSGDRALDTEHVFLAGLGAGGYWASETACRRPAIRAFAGHSAGSHPLTDCDTARAPVIVFHGLRDNVVPANCGRETRARWAQRNGCSENVEPHPVLGGVCEYSTGCPEGGQVVLCLFDDLGLAWAGGIGQPGVDPASFASASELSWEFFKTYAW